MSKHMTNPSATKLVVVIAVANVINLIFYVFISQHEHPPCSTEHYVHMEPYTWIIVSMLVTLGALVLMLVGGLVTMFCMASNNNNASEGYALWCSVIYILTWLFSIAWTVVGLFVLFGDSTFGDDSCMEISRPIWDWTMTIVVIRTIGLLVAICTVKCNGEDT